MSISRICTIWKLFYYSQRFLTRYPPSFMSLAALIFQLKRLKKALNTGLYILSFSVYIAIILNIWLSLKDRYKMINMRCSACLNTLLSLHEHHMDQHNMSPIYIQDICHLSFSFMNLWGSHEMFSDTEDLRKPISKAVTCT